jgi:hypothetical protein
MSFDEIDRLHGRELVNERKRRMSLNPLTAAQKKAKVKAVLEKKLGRKLTNSKRDKEYIAKALKILNKLIRESKGKKKNPMHPITAFAAGSSGILSALQIKELLKKRGPKRRKVAKRNAPKTNPKPAKIPHRRTFAMFQGRAATTAKAVPVSRHAPARLDQLGDLIELKLNSGRLLKFPGKKFKLCAAHGKLWIAGGKFAKPNPQSKANGLDAIDAIDHVVYGTYKPHHGDHKYTHYIHKLGEESGHLPTLAVDRDGFPVIRGGRYKVEARGIVN